VQKEESPIPGPRGALGPPLSRSPQRYAGARCSYLCKPSLSSTGSSLGKLSSGSSGVSPSAGMPWERPHRKAFPWPFLLPLPSCPGRERVPVEWDHPIPSPSIVGLRVPPSPCPHQRSKPHQATLFPCSSPATWSLPLRARSWDVGWGLTHLPRSCHRPWWAQPAPARPCLAPGGTRTLLEQNLPWRGTHPGKSNTKQLGSSRARGAWEGRDPQPVALPSLSPRQRAPRSARCRPKPRLGAPGDCSSSLGTESMVGAGWQRPLPSLTPLQGTPPKTPLAFPQPAGSQGARAGRCPPKYPCGVKGAAARLAQGEGSSAVGG